MTRRVTCTAFVIAVEEDGHPEQYLYKNDHDWGPAHSLGGLQDADLFDTLDEAENYVRENRQGLGYRMRIRNIEISFRMLK